ncbi:condensation domain-containing protein [Micromonospora sp. NPDC049051]|uniref:condensation domain-containing protein n=1 Tax=unclassified Micromonospora TaxID=2617518 RepID=UPI0037200834
MSAHVDYPLSAVQERLWFTMQIAPESSAYTIPLTWRLTGPVRTDHLARALQVVVDRHDSLRATFPMDWEGQPWQRVARTQPLSLAETDLSHLLPPSRRVEQAKALIDELSQVPVDIEEGPLVRATLIRLAEDDHVLYVDVHHLVFDGWSAPIFEHELGAAYRALARGEAVDLPEVRQYPQLWQRADDHDGDSEELEYWRENLADLTPTELPGDNPRPAELSYEGSSVQTTVAEPAVTALRELCREQRVSPYMAMLSVYFVLLRRYLRQDDLAVATPLSGRTDPDVENVIGCFVNTLAVRVRLSDKDTFRDVLEQVREQVLLAHENENVSYQQLITDLRVPRDYSRRPLCQLSFDLDQDGTDDETSEWHDVTVRTFRLDGTTSARFDLELYVGVTEERLRCLFTYSTALFHRSTVEEFARRFVDLAQRLLADPGRTLDEVDETTGEPQGAH